MIPEIGERFSLPEQYPGVIIYQRPGIALGFRKTAQVVGIR